MDEKGIIDHVKEQDLSTMYASVARMNEHIMNNNNAGVLFEKHLQENLRSNFRELQERQGIVSER